TDLANQELSPDRPLWAMHLIEGSEGGSAIVSRLHHCIADGFALAHAMLTLTDRADGIVTLTLNRPNQFNALSEEMLSGIQGALDRIAADDTIRVVVLAANGRAFCAGHDLKQMRASPDQSYYQRLFVQCSRMMLTIRNIPQPVIARVQGIATAAGCQLVGTCDLAVAAEEARFATSGINVGLFCSTPAVALSRNVSRKRAFEMLMTGDFIDAGTALDHGLINRVVPAADLDDAVAGLA
ncbi:MAG: enoyl-CoA hydratase, partial [bacterium]|nr:enoyl-CoA hydratase [bacterium]